jgi:hypothetical protein
VARLARQPGASRSGGDRLLGFLAAAAGIWAAVALVLAILVALVITLAVIGIALAVASAAGRPLHAGAGEATGARGRPPASRQHDERGPADAALRPRGGDPVIAGHAEAHPDHRATVHEFRSFRK